MRYLAFACDYDGTLASHGQVDSATISGLRQVLASGRKLILVTGRELPEILQLFPEVDVFDRVVAENGAVLYRPQSKEEQQLAETPPSVFIEALRHKGVQPLCVGRSIVATRHPFEVVVLETIRELNLELQVIFNKGAVMVLPRSTNKGTGLCAALADLGLSPHNVLGVGDAENDHAFFSICACSVAVANAVDSLKQRADFVTRAGEGAGVLELIEHLLADDLASLEPRLRHAQVLGAND